MTKKILFFSYFIISLAANRAAAQCSLYEIPLLQRIQSSTAIFEGKVISSYSFWDSGHSVIYTANKIEVFKMFKGAIVGAVIELITEGGIVGDKMEIVEPSLQLGQGSTGIFFAINSTIESPDNNTGNINFMSFAGPQGFVKYDWNGQTANEPFKKYNSIGELHDLIQKVTQNKYLIVKEFEGFPSQIKANSGNSVQTGPSISSFSPTTITAGTGSVLTINGLGFGAAQGTSFVEFKNADNAGASYIQPHSSQYILWSDTQIKVKVPSRTDVQANAGTGTIQVTVASTAATSSSPLTISYSEINIFSSSVIDQTEHIDDNSTGGYTFQLFTGFNSNTAAKDAFTRALNTWVCGTNMNWEIGATTSVDAILSDGVNVVRFDSGSELPSGVLGRCTSRYTSCSSGLWYVTELDVVFDDAANWHYSTSAPTGAKYDFESVALHELGHGHQLNHVIDNTDVMHYALTNASTSRTLNINNINAGNDVMSRNLVTNSCGPAKMLALTVSAPTAGAITQPTCSIATGSVVVSGLPAAGTWTLTISPGGTSTTGTGTSSTLTGLAAGTYTYAVANATGCTSLSSANIVINSQPSPPTAPTLGTITQTTCSVATGGAVLNGLPASGTWTLTRTPGGTITTGTGISSTITGLAAGTYSYTVSNGACTSSSSANIIINTPPQGPSAPTVGTITHPTCSTAGSAVLNNLPSAGAWTATLNPSGATMSGTGTSTTFAGIEGGTYTFTVTDAAGCTSALSASIVINASPVPTVNNIANVSACNGETTSVSVFYSTPAGATYTWANSDPSIGLAANGNDSVPSFVAVNATNLSITETITVTPTLNGCVGTSYAYSFTVDPTPEISQNGTVLSTGSAQSYQWFLNGQEIAGANNQSYNVTQNGNYTVVADSNSCSSAAISFNSTGIDSFSGGSFISIYPNPNDGEFIVSFNALVKATYTFKVNNFLGQLIFHEVLIDFKGAYSKPYDFKKHGKGIYFISISNANTEMVKKVVVN